jgi:hypothetical protein
MADVKAKETVPAAPGPAPGAQRPPDPLLFIKRIFLDSRNQLNIKLFNGLFLLVVAALGVRLAVIIKRSMGEMSSVDFRIASVEAGETKERSVLKKLEYYLDKVKKRDIFKMGAAARPENLIETGPSSKAVEATQNYKLVGISWSDDPDAMVEDIKTGKTFFVKRGQSIGDVKVENITKEKIVLRYAQELIELR